MSVSGDDDVEATAHPVRAPRHAELHPPPHYNAWRDLWIDRYRRDTAASGLGLWWTLTVVVGVIAGIVLTLRSETIFALLAGVAMFVGVLLAAAMRTHRKARNEFRRHARVPAAPSEGRLLRAQWSEYIASLGRDQGVIPLKLSFPVDGIWGGSVTMMICIFGPGLLSFARAGSSPLPSLLLMLVIAASHRLLASRIAARRAAALIAACDGNSCAWCGHGLPRSIEELTPQDRCPECGSPNPGAPPGLLQSWD